MTETNVQKFYRILAEKTEAFGTKKERNDGTVRV